MPLALAIIAVLLIMTAIKGNYVAVGQQVNATFLGSNGQNGFGVWFLSILGLAFLFRIIQAPKAGELFIALLIIVYFLQNNGILTNIENAIQGQTSSSNASSNSGSSATTTGASSGSQTASGHGAS